MIVYRNWNEDLKGFFYFRDGLYFESNKKEDYIAIEDWFDWGKS